MDQTQQTTQHFFDFTEGTGQKTTIRENERNKKENDNILDLRYKQITPPVHELEFDEIEDDENLGGNTRQINDNTSKIARRH